MKVVKCGVEFFYNPDMMDFHVTERLPRHFSDASSFDKKPIPHALDAMRSVHGVDKISTAVGNQYTITIYKGALHSWEPVLDRLLPHIVKFLEHVVGDKVDLQISENQVVSNTNPPRDYERF